MKKCMHLIRHTDHKMFMVANCVSPVMGGTRFNPFSTAMLTQPQDELIIHWGWLMDRMKELKERG